MFPSKFNQMSNWGGFSSSGSLKALNVAETWDYLEEQVDSKESVTPITASE